MRLNEPIEKFREFYGKNPEQMPKLIADNRVSMSAAGLMQRRLELRNSKDAELKASWMDNYFDIGDGALYVSDGSLTVAYDAQALRDMNEDSKLAYGALDLSDADLKDISGQRFTKEQLEKMVLGQTLTLKQARAHPVWQALAREDTKLLQDYTEMVFTDNKERFEEDNMGIYLGFTSDAPKMRVWYVGGAYSGSGVSGDVRLGDEGGRLVGVVSEMQK